MTRTLAIITVFALLACTCLACNQSTNPSQTSTPSANSTATATPPAKSMAKTPAAPPPAPVNPKAPVIKTFVAAPAIVHEGDTSTLKWEITNATSVTISPTVGTVDPLGSARVSPETSTVYTMMAVNPQGTIKATATVMVEKPHSTLLPVVFQFTSNPRMISENGSCVLSWDIYGATSVILASGTGSTAVTISDRLTPVGKMTFLPPYTLTAAEINLLPSATTVPATTVYTLTVNNIAGTTTVATDVTVLRTAILPKPGIPIAQDNMTVVAATAMPMIRWFSADPATIVQGNPAILSWEVIQANRVLLNGVPVANSGSQVISPASPATYTLTASNEYWSIAKVLNVRVLGYNAAWFKPLVH